MAKHRPLKGVLGRLSAFGARPVNRDALRLMRRCGDDLGKLMPLPRAKEVGPPKVVIEGWRSMTPEQKAAELRRLNKHK